ncbi:LCP family protein [Thermincola ferriacetica]
MKNKFFKIMNILALVAVFAGSFYIGNILANIGEEKNNEPVKIKAGDKKDDLPVDRLNVLLLGIDARKGEKDARTDTMILVSIDKETRKIAMLSIPRDTLVDIPGYGKSKINAANQIGGTDLAVDVVENLLGVDIPYYVKTNFEGFKDIVDTLGGVTIDVEKRMYWRDGKNTINLYKGVQRLDGNKALQYVRFRHDALGDISRTERQQKFLMALADEILQAKTIVKLPKLLPQIFSVVDTNFGFKDIFFLTRVASSLSPDNIVAQTLPGTFYNYKGISYWKADEEKTKLVLADMFKGVTTAAVVDKPINVPKDIPKKTSKGHVKKQTEVPPQNKPQVDVNIGETDSQTPQQSPNGSVRVPPPEGNTGNTAPTEPTEPNNNGSIINPANGTQQPGNGSTGGAESIGPKQGNSGVPATGQGGTNIVVPPSNTGPTGTASKSTQQDEGLALP